MSSDAGPEAAHGKAMRHALATVVVVLVVAVLQVASGAPLNWVDMWLNTTHGEVARGGSDEVFKIAAGVLLALAPALVLYALVYLALGVLRPRPSGQDRGG
ncbi:MAG TPA: hypothetical protein VIE16_06885 [Phenylobacterium sp.]|jgi:hypothetical protein